MAEQQNFEARTEAPSPRRREEAHEQGQFAFSPELTSGVALLVGIAAMAFLATTLGGGLLNQIRIDLTFQPPANLTPGIVQRLLGGMFGRALLISGALLGLLFLATVVVSVAQSGFHLNPGKLAIDFERVPFMDFGRLVGWNKILRGMILVLKIAAVATVAWWILRQRGGEIARVGEFGLAEAVARSWSIILRLALGLAGTLVVIGVVDYGFQRWRFEQSLYMTRQELKEEIKREDGDPQIKARIRRMQREIANRKMLQKVPRATVVITNPTHLAVAIQYQAGQNGTPRVVAKGAGHVAKKIVELARKHGVTVLERKPLAQALFKTVKVDREIPLAFYVVVAELLAFVYRLKGIPA